MTDDLRTHWLLHRVDEEAVRLEGERTRIARELAALDQRLAMARNAVRRQEQELESRGRERAEHDRVLGELDAAVQAAERQCERVMDERALEAARQQLAHARERRDEREVRALGDLETEDRERAALPGLVAELERVLGEHAEQTGRRVEEQARVDAARGTVDAERERLLTGLAAPARERYLRLRRGRDGRALAELRGGACRACGTVPPPHALQEARRRTVLVACEGCARLMLLAPEDDA